jgi:hypothetical protein
MFDNVGRGQARLEDEKAFRTIVITLSLQSVIEIGLRLVFKLV